MIRQVRATSFVIAIWLGTTVPGLAKTVVVPPLVSRSTSAETVLSMTTLLAGELDFVGEFDEVKQLEKRPSGWGWGCIKSTSCIGGITRSNGGQALVGGSVSKVGDRYDINLVYYDGGRIVRSKSISIPTAPSAVADGISSHVRTVVTGVSPESTAKAARVEGFEGGAMDILDDEEESDSFNFAAAPVSRRLTTPSGGGGYDDLDDLDEFDEFDEDEEDRRGGGGGGYAAAAVGGVAAGAAVGYGAASAGQGGAAASGGAYGSGRAAAGSAAGGGSAYGRSTGGGGGAAATETFDPNAIQFGSATDNISVESITFGSAASMIQVDQGGYDEDPVSDSPRVYDDLDNPQPARTRAPRERRQRPARSVGNNSSAGTFSITGRMGYARFQQLGFVTYGFEGAYQIQDTLAVVAGLEAHSTRRILDPQTVPEGQPAAEWNTILPFNLGAMYKPTFNKLRPYGGAGLQFIPGYVKSVGGTAVGFRARGGVDYILTDNIGLNANMALGMWTGKEFDKVQEGLKPAGFVPQFSAGTVFLF